MRLNSLTIINFKGIKSLKLTLDGNSATIFGSNATGKTSTYDAFLWLLFGKDSRGATNFSIKPIVNGEPIHNVETYVEADIQLENGSTNLIRRYKEIWTRKRGDSTETFTGHETSFFVDGLPVNQATYKRAVESIMPETLFRVLTNPFHFPEAMKWQDRRSQLFKLFADLTDANIASQDPRFMDLLQKAGRYSVEEYATGMKARIRKYNDELQVLPARIDEAARQIIEDDDEDAAEEALENVAKELRGLKAAMETTDDEDLVKQKTAVETEILQLQQKNNAYRERARAENAERNRKAMNDLAEQLEELKIPEMEATAAVEKRKYEELTRSIEDLRARFAVKASEPFVPQEICQACGRPFSEHDMEAARKAFESARKQALDQINAEGRELAEKQKAAKKRASEASGELNRRKRIRAEYEQAMKELRTADLAPDMEGYADAMKSLTERRASIMEAIMASRANAEERNQKLASQISERQQAYIMAKNAVTACKASRMAKARVGELRDQQTATVEALEDSEAMLALCEEFIRARVSAVEESVNKHFKLVKWQLYREQINGGLEEICEATVNGIPFHDLNGAMRINAGLDVINACIIKTGKSAPIFVDNAESVVSLYKLNAQVIRLVVSENDKQLRLQK